MNQKITLRQKLVQYSNDVINLNVIACKKHKWACMRFLRDLEREGTEGFPFVFDDEKAELFLYDWMPLFNHSKGPLADTPKIPDILEEFVFGNIYGWVHKDTGLRRFRRAYWQVARKNAKSQNMAIMGLYEMSAFGESCSEVYVAATKKDQTKYVWGEADYIYPRSNSEAVREAFITKYGIITHDKSGSFFARMSKEDKKKGDGSNPQCGILDEYHAHETTEYYDVLSSGMKTRRQPLLFIITTAGFELNNPCYRVEYDYVSKILNPSIEVENDRYFVMINELDKDDEGNLVDEIRDEKAWLKSNPIIAKTEVGLESIRTDLVEALDKPEKMRDFLTKTMNIWINQREAGYMNMDKWKSCGIIKDTRFSDVIGLRTFPGIDLSATLDLTSIGFDIPLPNGCYGVLSHSFIPEETLEAKRKTDKVPYDLWVKKGWITVTPGAEVDYHLVLEYLLERFEWYKWPKGECCFDRALATWLMHEVELLGFTPIDIPQNYTGLSEATKDFRAKTYNKKLIHDNNPVLSWAMSNAVIRKSPNESIMLDKDKAVQRIDPVAALITAHVRAMVNEDNRSVYEERGIRSG